MFSLFYDLSLILFATVALPKLLWQWCVHGKYRKSLKARIGISLPSFSPKNGQEVIWIHAVSMGETRAVIPLFRKIRQAHPEAAIVISTTTETGHAEAKRSMPEADTHFLLPLDFSWIMRRIIHRIQPTSLILCESDFWYHLLKMAKERGVHVHLVNGKVSERSCRRFRKFIFFTRRLFAHFDFLCVQSDRYHDRFISMGIPPQKLFVTGNLKFDSPTKKMSPIERQSFKESLHFIASDPVLVIGSTHAPEEEWILSALNFVWKRVPTLKVLLVPRHPERFNEVAHLIQERGVEFSRLSEKKKRRGQLVLIDAMGRLNQCYQIADLAIVGGSYTSHVGGHNIFEPVVFGVPVLFGPHMHSQPDLEELVLSSGAGRKVNMEQLPEVLIGILNDAAIRHKYVDACNHLAESVQGATERTFSHLFSSKNPE
jgi:3-deoxy-D-manno-octulosonic-acid transferase